jgi:menaquinone-9 beta-reductase
MQHYDILIAGGGIAGLTSALRLSLEGFRVLLIEKRSYPFHRVCGEYISNEVLPYLTSLGADPLPLGPARIDTITVTGPTGKSIKLRLQQGGFGISRYTFDLFLYDKAKQAGAEFLLNTKINSVRYTGTNFITRTENGNEISSDLVIGGFGKRSNLDKQLNRSFINKKSPYIGVKYHIHTNLPSNEIQLHNFKDGYCGLSKTETDRYCLCYLTTRENLRKYGNIGALEDAVLYRNPYLKKIFLNSRFYFKKPEVISEITFGSKKTFEDNIFMCGDASGMITPLCGNGMAIAIHSSKILADIITKHYTPSRINLQLMADLYSKEWNKNFRYRLMAGRNIQKLFGNEFVTDLVIGTLRRSKSVTDWLVRQTHGEPF